MANIRKEINYPFFEEVAKRYEQRLNELGLTKYAVCRDNPQINRPTLDRITSGKRSLTLNTLIEYLDVIGLELKIVAKEN